jgi:hypothetical protein
MSESDRWVYHFRTLDPRKIPQVAEEVKNLFGFTPSPFSPPQLVSALCEKAGRTLDTEEYYDPENYDSKVEANPGILTYQLGENSALPRLIEALCHYDITETEKLALASSVMTVIPSSFSFARGGITVVVQDGKFACSFCLPGDNYDKKLGLTIAQGKINAGQFSPLYLPGKRYRDYYKAIPFVVSGIRNQIKYKRGLGCFENLPLFLTWKNESFPRRMFESYDEARWLWMGDAVIEEALVRL